MKLLAELYPRVDWSRVDFYEGLPWFTPAVAPYVTAQALPDFYSFSKYRIYLLRFDETRAQCLSDLVHEAFHVMQAMEFNRGYGVGFFRGFLFYYLALFFKHGYRNNPFEIPAYDQEFRFLQVCLKYGIRGMVSSATPDALAKIGKEKELQFSRFEFSYQGSPLALIGSLLLCVLITITKPLADLLVMFVGLFLRKKKDRGGP